MHKQYLILSFAIYTSILTGCGAVNNNNNGGNSNEVVVGFSIYATYDDYTSEIADTFMKIMKKEKVSYIIRDAQGDAKKQISDVESLIGEKVDVLCILPLDETTIRNSLNEASLNGIPIISIGQIPWTGTSITISGGDYANGRSAGEAMKNNLNGTGEAAVINYPHDFTRLKERISGFKDALNASEIKIVDNIKAAGTEDTMESVKALLLNNPNIKGIFASDSFQLIGCGAALKALGRKDITVTGIGSETVIIDMIEEGYVTAAAARASNEQGELTAYSAIKLLRKESYDKNYEVSTKIIDRNNARQIHRSLY